MKRIFLLIALLASLAPWGARAASIITTPQAPAVSQWICFRKTIDIAGNPEKNSLSIAADSKYWLYVNGKPEVFEGQLKRGPNRKDTYIDCMRLKNLRKGKNTIAVLVWYYGKDGFSHRNSKAGGLYFDLAVGKTHYGSDDTWRTAIHPAFYIPEGDVPNWRLPESNIGFDARKDIPAWRSEGFDDSAWAAAKRVTPAEADWNGFAKREIPQWKDYGVKTYPAQRREGNKIVCTLPYNCQFTPVMKIRAAAGKVVDVRTDDYRIPAPGGERSVRAEYITKGGEQEYESLGWMNGHEAIYTIPDGVEVVSLGYRETGYDCAFAGSFECDNEVLNSIWKKSQRTLYITMRDTYMDCPDRERAQWIGDVSNEMVEVFYSLSPSANLLTRKCAREFADWQRDDSVLYAPVPAGNWDKELPQQTMAFMGLGNWNYYMGTGDEATIKHVFPAAKRYVHKWKIQDDGLVEHREGEWDFGDWGSNIDINTLCEAWYSVTLQNYAKQAALIGDLGEAKWAEAAAGKLNESFRSKFWTGTAYRHSSYKDKTDERAQALAVISGIATKEQYPAIREIIRTTEFASPYIERYVLQALCQMGYYQDALDRIIRRYKPMADSPLTTLWEQFNLHEGSYNHAWSGGPLIILSQYIAGIEPTKAGFKEFDVKPELCNLRHVSAVVPSVNGNIKLSINASAGYKVSITVPKGTKARLLLPAGHAKWSVDGHAKTLKPSADGTKSILRLSAGKHTVEAL